MTDLTPEKRAELRALDAAATQAPWCEHPNGTSAWRGPDWETVNNSTGPQYRHVCNATSVDAAGLADLELIVAMRNSFGALLDALDEKERELASALEAPGGRGSSRGPTMSAVREFCGDCGLPFAKGRETAQTEGVCAHWTIQGRHACERRTVAKLRAALAEHETSAMTQAHINLVRIFLRRAATELLHRGEIHDLSKFSPEEVKAFTEFTPKLRGSTYGSEEYKSFLSDMKPALEHHYAANRHHPEHFANGIEDMNLFDVLEMFIDWLASTKRHADGDIMRSIEINRDRFGMAPQLVRIFQNTARDFDRAKP